MADHAQLMGLHGNMRTSKNEERRGEIMLSEESIDLLKEKRCKKMKFMLSLGNQDIESIEVVVTTNGEERRETVSLDATKIALFYDLFSAQNIISHNDNIEKQGGGA